MLDRIVSSDARESLPGFLLHGTNKGLYKKSLQPDGSYRIPNNVPVWLSKKF